MLNPIYIGDKMLKLINFPKLLEGGAGNEVY
jgi:hypothetical protein